MSGAHPVLSASLSYNPDKQDHRRQFGVASKACSPGQQSECPQLAMVTIVTIAFPSGEPLLHSQCSTYGCMGFACFIADLIELFKLRQMSSSLFRQHSCHWSCRSLVVQTGLTLRLNGMSADARQYHPCRTEKDGAGEQAFAPWHA